MGNSLVSMPATRRFLYLAVGMIPLGRLLSVPLFASAGKVAALTPIEIALALVIVAYCGTKLWRGQWSTTHVPGFRVIMLFPLWCLVSLTISTVHFGLDISATAFSALYLARWVGYSLLYFITYEIAVDSHEVRKVAKWVLTGGIAFAGFGIAQAVFLPYDFALALYPDARPYVDYDPQGHRLVSTFLDPNIAAGFLLIPTIIGLSFWAHGVKRWTVPLIVLLIAFAATVSRGGAVGFVVGVFFLFKAMGSLNRKVLKTSLVIIIVLLSLYPLLSTEIVELNRFSLDDGSAMARLAEWKLATDVIRDNWIVGIGFNTFGYIWPEYGPAREGGSAFGMENDFIMILMLTGIVGFAVYFRMYMTMLQPLADLRDKVNGSWDQAFGRGVWAATLGVTASSFFTTLILYPQIMAILWILWALGRRLQKFTPVENPAAGLIPAPARV